MIVVGQFCIQIPTKNDERWQCQGIVILSRHILHPHRQPHLLHPLLFLKGIYIPKNLLIIAADIVLLALATQDPHQLVVVVAVDNIAIAVFALVFLP